MVKLSKISAAQKIANRKTKHSMETENRKIESNQRVQTMEDLMTFTESNDTRGGGEHRASSKQADSRQSRMVTFEGRKSA